MQRLFWMGVLAVALVSPASAQHGLLDEIEIVEPGLVASLHWESPQQESPDPCITSAGEEEAKKANCSNWISWGMRKYIGEDAAGARYFVGQSPTAEGLFWGVFREVSTFSPNGDELVLRVVRDATTVDSVRHFGDAMERWSFDVTNGSLYISLHTGHPTAPNDWSKNGVIKVEGFPTMFEILQTYEPSTNEISFRVPYMPEGFEDADWFDTYYGDLATVGDWSKAQGLECMYPNTPPEVGDYLTVADTLPTPSPGQGYYYVTAATFQGETRYGRKAAGGELSGRDPAVLPACSPFAP